MYSLLSRYMYLKAVLLAEVLTEFGHSSAQTATTSERSCCPPLYDVCHCDRYEERDHSIKLLRIIECGEEYPTLSTTSQVSLTD